MATPGFLGFTADGTDKIAYAHFDSYPSGVGLTVLAWLRDAAHDLEALRRRITALKVVGLGSQPTPRDIAHLAGYADPLTPIARIRYWWELLWKTQGDPEATLTAGVIEDASHFPTHSWCEWGYMIDLDAQVLEVYRGRQLRPHQRGRFAAAPGADRRPPALLVIGWPLDQLPSDERFLTALNSA